MYLQDSHYILNFKLIGLQNHHWFTTSTRWLSEIMSGYDLLKFFESYGDVIYIEIISSVEINQRENLSSYDF